MQSGRNVVESAKESVANVSASALSGLEKTKATVQEKIETLTGGDPIEHRIAKDKKEQRIAQAELEKLEARDQNAATKLAAKAGGGAHPGYTDGSGTATYSTTGQAGHTPGTHQMSALPGHGTGQPAAGQVVEGVTGAHPIGPGTATHSTTGQEGHTPGTHQVSALPGHGTGQPAAGQVGEGVAGAHPISPSTDTYSTTGQAGHTPGTHQMSALPGHGTGQPASGQDVEGVTGAHPIGTKPGTLRSDAAHNTHHPPGGY